MAFSVICLLAFTLLLCQQVGAYKVCNVMENGALGNGVDFDDTAFLKSFNDCVEGGQVLVPAGTYLLSPFNLTSNIELYLDHGATILASTNFSSYPIVAPLPSYPDDYNGGRTGPFIGGTNISNARIAGHGTIDGQGQVWWDAEDKSQFPYGRGRMIEPMFCSNFSMVGVTVKNPAFWGIHPYACDNLLFEDVVFYAPVDSPNTDGLDPDSCSNVIIRNFSATSGDDAIAIKSGRDEYGRVFNRPSYNILIEGGVMGRSRGINIGSEMSGHVYNVHVRNVKFVRSDYAVRIKTARGRGGKVYNITYENLTFEANEFGVAVNMNYGSNPASGPTDEKTPHLYEITYRNITGTALNAGFFEGLPESAARDITLADVDIRSRIYKMDSPLARFECFHAFGSVEDVSRVHPSSCLKTQQ